MLWPISLFISPGGWCDENTSICFRDEDVVAAAGRAPPAARGDRASFRKRASVG
jgi:hypothetical protein